MNIIENYKTRFDEYIENTAIINLTDKEYELEYQGLIIQDKLRYLITKGVNLTSMALANGITL